MEQFKNIGIISRPGNVLLESVLKSLLSVLRTFDVDLFLDISIPDSVQADYPVLFRDKLATSVNVVIVVGGDGTLLHAARSLVNYDIPIIGVNVGRLGFVVDISPAKIEQSFKAILNGHYQIEERILLYSRVVRKDKLLFDGMALNDVSMHVRDAIRMIEFETTIDGRFVSRQRADGLVVATPTGSTAYSLSGGGPIVHPGLETFTLVPICPHTLTSRPIVVSADSQISITQVADTETLARIALDGQDTFNIQAGDRLDIMRHRKKLKLIHPDDYDYFQILRNKLRWNEQP